MRISKSIAVWKLPDFQRIHYFCCPSAYRMKIKRYIAGLLLVCFSVFLGHNLVPHHHHSEAFNSPITTDCPFEHGDQHEHDHDSDAEANEHPTHCHAFNDVVFEKYSVPLLRLWAGSLLALIVPGQPKLPEVEQGHSPYTFVVLKLPCKTAAYLGSRGLRAPPVLV